MLRGYRGIIVALIGVALLLTFGVGVYSGALTRTNQQSQTSVAGAPSSQSNNTRPQQSGINRSGVPSLFERFISNPEPATDQEREKRDLAAQEASAAWAFWVVVIGAFSALVTMLGTILLYQQIKLTREAVQDTGKATSAMQRQNDIAQEAQRPWVTLAVKPILSIPHMGGIHFRAEIIANNVGHSPATNFGMRSKFIIRDVDEDAHAAIADYAKIVEQWRAEIKVGPESVLLPNSTETGPFWTNENVAPSLIEKVFEIDAIYPTILIAAFYRTQIEPLVIQTAWRVWRVSTIEQSGDAVSFFRIDRTFKSDFLQVESLTGLRHITTTAEAA